MSKVICDICGTSFPESATQCPICGCVRPAEVVSVPETEEEKTGYTYVKGGRFSKANVRKRNQMRGQTDPVPGGNHEKDSSGKKLVGLIIVLTCLILIIGCVIAYIFMNWDGLFDGNQSQSEPDMIPCTSIELSQKEFSLKNPGDTAKIQVTFYPFNTTDETAFTSSDKSVVTVDENGEIKYVGTGEADITVTCGLQSVTCHVVCEEVEPVTVPPTEIEPQLPEITLERTDISGDDVIAGVYQWRLYDPVKNPDLPAEAITWLSDDETVATVDNEGVVYAVGAGSTVIRAIYEGQMLASCKITVIDEDQVEDPTVDDVTEPEETQKPTEPTEPAVTGSDLTLYTQYGKTASEGDASFSFKDEDDITYNLIMKDEEGNKVAVKWTVKQGDCTLNEDGNSVKVNSDETCKLQAEYNGKTYTLIIY